MSQQSTQDRKFNQIQVCLNKNVEFKRTTAGFEKYRFVHQALPEINKDEIDLSLEIFGKRLRAPIIIEPMTGGTEVGQKINLNLARAAQEFRIGMGVGSERVAIENPSLTYTFQVRDVAPDILLFANIGAIQLNNSFGVEECYQAVNMIGADALVLHLNPLQEAIQQGGNTNFKHLLSQIQKVCSQLTFPVIVKETGCGMSKEVALKLKKAEVAGIDVSGAGGTSWAIVEAAITNDRIYQKIGNRFAEWGIPTAESLIMTRAVAPDLLLIASGGIRSGIDVAKAIALGADAVGLALPLLKPATESADMVAAIIRRILTELEIAMFCIGAENLRELKNTSFLE